MKRHRTASPAPGVSRRNWIAPALAAGLACAILNASSANAGEADAVAEFRKNILPILEDHCYDCHGDGSNKGGIAFDELKTDDAVMNHDLWLKVLKNVRAGLMPPK